MKNPLNSFLPCLLIAASIALPEHAAAQPDTGWCKDGRRAFHAERYEEANKLLSSCLYSRPEDPATAADGYYMRGVTYLQRPDMEAALGDFDLAIEIFPQHAYAWQQKSWVHYLGEDYHPAIVAIENSLRNDPNNTKSHHIHALILTAMERPDQAMDAYDLAYSFERRDTIMDLQRALQAQGYSPGAVDGNYGGRTRDALKACIAAGCSFML